MRYYIYKYVVDDKIVYIGKTKRKLGIRIGEHARETKFIKYRGRADIYWFECDSNIEMDIAERILILRYRPELNVTDNLDVDLTNTDFREPVWRAYRDWREDDAIVLNVLSDDSSDESDEFDKQDILWQNFESWLEYIFDSYINSGLDYMSKNKIRYTWDLDLYPLPDFVKINNHTYSCYSSARKSGVLYECVIDIDSLEEFISHGKSVSRDMRMAITMERLRKETA